MNEEQIKKMIADDFDNLINERLDSAIIFKYISNIEKENKNLKDQLEQSIAVADTNSELAESYYNENQKLKEQISNLECLVESIKLGVTLNQYQEDLLDKILFRSDKQ